MLQDGHLKSAPQVFEFTKELEHRLGLGETPIISLLIPEWNVTGPSQPQQSEQASRRFDSSKDSTTRKPENPRIPSSVLHSKTRKYAWIWMLASFFVILSSFSTFFAYQLLIRKAA